MSTIGIDLGTTNSLIAVWNEEDDTENSYASLISNATGSATTPSAVSVLEDGSIVVGQAAYERRLTHPELTATEFKRDIGSGRIYKLGKHKFSSEQLSALILNALKADAEAELGKPIEAAVISVPAYFNDHQRKATLAAAELAELNVTRLINEPTAAALSFGVGQTSDDSHTTFVFDLGGGTFDVSLVDFFEGIVEIKASTGDNYLGGEDFTTALAKLVATKAGLTSNAEEWSTKISSAQKAIVRSAAERLKRSLGREPVASTTINIDSNSTNISVTEAEFESCCEELLKRIRSPITRALRDSRIDETSIDSVVLVGGATRMPIIRKLVARLLGRFPDASINPDEAIALGAATQAALVAQNSSLKEVLLTDVCPYSLGIGSLAGQTHLDNRELVLVPIIERNTLLPASREQSFGSASDMQKQVEFNVYQGEHRYAKDNIELGKLTIKIPPKPKGEVEIKIRLTYDVSGILDVDALVPDTGETTSLTVVSNATSMSKADLKKRRSQLEKLKIHPRSDLANKALVERADRLYTEMSGQEREQIGQALDSFMSVLNSQDTQLIERKRRTFSEWLDEVEALLN